MAKPKSPERPSHSSAQADRSLSTLRNINWSFSTPFSPGRSGVRLFDSRKYHWYPATFIPEIPYTLIEVLTEPGAVIYDPFAGIGTTLFQAALLGRRPFGTEISQASVVIMRALWRLLSPRSELGLVGAEIERLVGSYNPAKDYSLLAERTAVRFDELRPWFAPQTCDALKYLAVMQDRAKGVATQAAIQIAASATLKAVCAQTRGWGCVADNVLPKAEDRRKTKDALGTFSGKIRILLTDLGKARERMSEDARAVFYDLSPEQVILEEDARAIAGREGTVDLLVTSPPYLSMTDYAYSQRLSYYWLGADPSTDVRREIGARRKRFHSNAPEEYIDGMQAALRASAATIRRGGYACFVMPQFEGDLHNNTVRRQAVQQCMGSLPSEGLVLVEKLERMLPLRRRHHNQHWTRLERESISIYRKTT